MVVLCLDAYPQLLAGRIPAAELARLAAKVAIPPVPRLVMPAPVIGLVPRAKAAVAPTPSRGAGDGAHLAKLPEAQAACGQLPGIRNRPMAVGTLPMRGWGWRVPTAPAPANLLSCLGFGCRLDCCPASPSQGLRIGGRFSFGCRLDRCPALPSQGLRVGSCTPGRRGRGRCALRPLSSGGGAGGEEARCVQCQL